jgi:hypothetical protein
MSRDNPLDHACTVAFAGFATFNVNGSAVPVRLMTRPNFAARFRRKTRGGFRVMKIGREHHRLNVSFSFDLFCEFLEGFESTRRDCNSDAFARQCPGDRATATVGARAGDERSFSR